MVGSGTTNLTASSWTAVDLPRTWTFTREQLRFEIDSAGAIAEYSESNNAVTVFTDAISAGFWVEQSLYDHFHRHQHKLNDGANGWEDWAQRHVDRWNAIFANSVYPVDAPNGVLDRIRLDKITIVPDGALPLAGGYASNNPDNRDTSVDLVWGFATSLLNGGGYSDFTSRSDSNPFYFEGSLMHELGHARYLIDAYGFNVVDGASDPRVTVTHSGTPITGTPYLPRSYPWFDHVLINHDGMGGVFDGLMGSSFNVKVDRYSTAAMNLIAGRRAIGGNYNAPMNLGVFIHNLSIANRIQLLDEHPKGVKPHFSHFLVS